MNLLLTIIYIIYLTIVPLSADEKVEKEAWITENIASIYDLCIQKAIETEDKEEEVYSRVLLGRLYTKLGDFVRAKEAYDSALALYQAPYRIADHADVHFLEAKAFCENYLNQRFNDDHPEEVSMYLLRLYMYIYMYM
jgi:tetratricopeptide (TPR) repeat protein